MPQQQQQSADAMQLAAVHSVIQKQLQEQKQRQAQLLQQQQQAPVMIPTDRYVSPLGTTVYSDPWNFEPSHRIHCFVSEMCRAAELSIYFLIFSPFYFFLSFICFTYFFLLSIPSLSTRIVPLRFQAGGRRR